MYPQYEDPAAVNSTFVNHAHNDYLEIALETGIAGVLLVAAFLLWWSCAVPIWRSAAVDRYALAGSIASAAILVHSLVDYPLRTAALSAIMAASLALMARPRPRSRKSQEVGANHPPPSPLRPCEFQRASPICLREFAKGITHAWRRNNCVRWTWQFRNESCRSADRRATSDANAAPQANDGRPGDPAPGPPVSRRHD